MGKLTRRHLLLLVVFGLLGLLAAGVVQAQLKATAVVYAWDQENLQYKNSNVAIAFNGEWVQFMHELGYDKTDYLDACGTGTSTPWAGILEYGLYHEDLDGAPGFQETREWKLIHCDRDGDGDFDNADLSVRPPDSYTEYSGGVLEVVASDVETECTTGNCLNEIVTTLFINMDVDCDGNLNTDIPDGGVCFYAEARTPPPPTGPLWSGPLQARISAGGGDKTVNFKITPLAVTLSSFSATWQGNGVLVAWETALELNTAGFNVWRSTDPEAGYVQANDTMIPSAFPGAGEPASYSYYDGDIQPGTDYYYKLEELELGGTSNWYGPVVATSVARGSTVYLPLVYGR